MIPLTVAEQIHTTLLDYLLTTFNFQDEVVRDELLAFLQDRDNGLFKGPYVNLRRPYRRATEDAPIPLDIQPPFLPFVHQMQAFERLTAQQGNVPQPTLVTTGTGSGKTEAFLYPILDYCHQHVGQPGIKAIILYPMNALATDQAGRLSSILWNDQRLRNQVTAGIFIGGQQKRARKNMGPDWLIDDHNTLREHPPDILLTNYKMLDFLLLRPRDRSLWSGNEPDTLRFLVLDELHTYDGAQGTDVACLIRRLKARLRTPEGSLCPVGTSATIGGGSEQALEKLTDFASEIFGETFDQHAVIQESLVPLDEFLPEQPTLFDIPSDVDGLSERPGETAEVYAERQCQLWFDQSLDPFALGEALKSHNFLHTLLAVTKGEIVAWEDLRTRLGRWEPEVAEQPEEEQDLLLASFLALIAQARAPESAGHPAPLLTLQVQLWVREMSRLMRKVGPDPGFFWREDVALDQLPRGLPAYFCRECGHSGWLSFMRDGDTRISDELRDIYNAYFEHHKNSRYLYPGQSPGHLPGTGLNLCPDCLWIGHDERCPECDAETFPVVLFHETSTPDRAGQPPRDLQRCPVCGTDNALSIVGSQAASLSSVAIGHLFTTPLNNDKKLLAFTDSVQDASHRAAFFSARTYRFSMRAAIQAALSDPTGLGDGSDPVVLSQFTDRLLAYWRARWRQTSSPEQRIAATFMPPDLKEMPSYVEYINGKPGPMPPDLRNDLAKRLSWEVAMEYGFNARLGRSLEKVGSSAAYIDPDKLDPTVERLALILREEIALLQRVDDDNLRHFVLGLLERSRMRGGIAHPLLAKYANEQGSWYMLSKKMQPLLSPFHKRSPRYPKFLTDSSKRDVFDLYLTRGVRRTWYVDWAHRALSSYLGIQEINEVYRVTVSRLVEAGLLRSYGRGNDHAYGLDPATILVTTRTASICCDVCNQQHTVPASEEAHWLAQTCLSYQCDGHYQPDTRGQQHYYQALYERGEVERVFSHEHTGLLSRKEREQVEREFKNQERADATNLLSATPTLEMGIDIGDLSTTMAISVPPSTTNYLQRIGRAGRKTGNSLVLTLANARPHDLYFYDEPLEMIAGVVTPPGLFLDAPSILKRQLLAFTMDIWTATHTNVKRLPRNVKEMLRVYPKGGFPEDVLDFYEASRQELIDAFLEMFGPVVSAENQSLLRACALSDELPAAVRDAIAETVEERDELRAAYKSVKRQHDQIEADPAEYQEPEKELLRLEQEMNVFIDMIKRIEGQYILNFFTDAGLLPNYAFPESGVKLRAIITGFKVDQQESGKRYLVKEYVRPAGLAIRELAPFNTFYAEGRKLKVDHVEIPGRDKSVEQWQFCDQCGYMELVQTHHYSASCAKCGSSGWADVGQKHNMLRFQQASSWSDQYESQARDDTDEREQASYQTEHFFHLRPQDSSGAVLIPNLPFGLEHFSEVTLRQINFGPVETFGAKIEIAGQERPVQGFKVCRDCGAIQPFMVDEHQSIQVKHTRSCASKAGKGQVEWEEIYLYREMSSEALRILLPVSTTLVSEKLETFAASFALGLRLHLGGDPDHLSMWSHTEVGLDGVQRRFLMVYDEVPGGTSYLKDLTDPDTFRDVLQLARDALASCSCRLDGGKKACYRCLYSYRQGNHELLSRQLGLELVQQVLANWSHVERVATLTGADLHSVLESELEQRFVDALADWAKDSASVSFSPLIYNGKRSWLLKIGEQEWVVEPQVWVGTDQGVEITSRPDFVLWPHTASGRGQRAVAVLTDGFAYHVLPHRASGRVGDDLRKRRALVESGRFWTWSITWDDVEEFAEKKALETGPLLGTVQRQLLRRMAGGSPCQWHNANAVRQLLDYLSAPAEDDIRAYAGAVAASLLDQRPPVTADLLAGMRTALITEPAPPDLDIPYGAPDGDQMYGISEHLFNQRLVTISQQHLQQRQVDAIAVTLRLDDRADARGNDVFKRSWRRFWLFANIFQFLPLFAAATSEEIARQAPAAPAEPEEQPAPGEVLSSEWQDAFDYADPACRSLLDACHAAGLPAPVVGYELADEAGQVVAMSELAWEAAQVAVFLPAQQSDRDAFLAQGWGVHSSDDPDAMLQALQRSDEVA
ncbi:MAG: DEAD/DEAH box helicase [Chloroflexota bacterium]|nr:DEAD/DEAH box helicase [Chloroflexota bacterium]